MNNIHKTAIIEDGAIIGDNVTIGAYTIIGAEVNIGNNCVFANVATLAGHVEVDDYVVVGGLTPIHQFCKLGSHAMIGGGSVVTQDIPPFCLAEGNRANLRGLNLNGLRRRLGREDINAVKKAYKEIFESGQPIQEVANELIKTQDNKYVLEFTNFIINTKRGIPFIRKQEK